MTQIYESALEKARSNVVVDLSDSEHCVSWAEQGGTFRRLVPLNKKTRS